MSRLHAYLARFLPQPFRRLYADEMRELVAARHVEVAAESRWRRTAFWAKETADLALTLTIQWLLVLKDRAAQRNTSETSLSFPEKAIEMFMNVLADLRLAFRNLASRPVLTAIIVATVAVGISATTSVYTLVDSVLIRPLPFEDSERLVFGYGAFPLTNSASVSPPDYLDYRDRSASFDELAAILNGNDTVVVGGADTPEPAVARQATHQFFDALGISPLRGRGFSADETVAGGPAVVVISEGFWRRRFGADPAIVGREMLIDESSATIIGVLPASLALFGEPDIWQPLRFGADDMTVRRFHFLRVVGRLSADVDLAVAQEEIDTIAADLAITYPESNTDWTMRLVPLHEAVVGPVQQPLFMILSAVAAVLLIGCFNVAILLLARATRRAPELAMRSALGASRGRIIRLLLTESFVLATAGGLLGILLAYRGVDLLVAMASTTLPRADEIEVNGSVLVFSVVLTIGTGILFGLVPALRTARDDIGVALSGHGTVAAMSGRRVRNALVVGQVALSFALLVGAGLMIRSFIELSRVEPGFAVNDVVTTAVSLPGARYQEDSQRRSFFDEFFERVEGMPAIEAVAGIDVLPLTGGNDTFAYPAGAPPEQGSQGFNAQFRSITRGYFETMRIPLLQGRTFSSAGVARGTLEVILDEPFADALFPGGDAVGERIIVDLGEPTTAEVVGVVGGVLHFGPIAGTYGTMYFPYAERPRGTLGIVVFPAGNAGAAADGLRTALAELDDQLPLAPISPLSEMLSSTVAAPQFRARLMAIFAGSALFLAAAGLYGVLAYFVAERRRELGVRLALGADANEVVALVLRHGMRLVGLGLAIGMVAAAALAWWAQSLVFVISAADPLSFAAVAVVLAGVATIACLLPALRATRVDPLEVLRTE